MKSLIRLLLLPGFLLFALPNARSAITGHWSFENSDLFFSAKIGFPMLELDNDTALNTTFGTTGSTFPGVPDIGGQPAAVMRFPKTTGSGGYFVPPGATANGGGNNINQYTLIFDILFPSESSGKVRALFQTDAGGNAEFFVNAANQIGADGLPFAGNLTPDVWHRVAFAVDLAASPPSVAYFIDGVKVFEGNPGGILDGRLSISVPIATYSTLFFANDDDGQTELGYVNSIQFRDAREVDGVIAALGAPTAGGILTGPLPDPFLISVSPSPESIRIPERSTVGPLPLIQAVLIDGTNALDTTQVTMQVNGQPVVANVVKTDGTNVISYTPTVLLPPFSTNSVRIDYLGLDGTPYVTAWQFFVGRYQALAASAAGPLGSGVGPGFRVRTAQAPTDAVIPNVNSFPRAIRQLNGTLTDTGGVVVANTAIPGGNPDGSYNESAINYHLGPGAFGNFEGDTAFPGIAVGDVFATEVLTHLELAAGTHRLGVSVSVDRTDTGTDDGFTLYAGVDARNIVSPVIGTFARNVLNAFISTHNNNEFTVVAPVAGVYSFRLVHFQTFQDSSLEFYSVEPGTTNKILINDPLNPQAIRGYRSSTATFANKPYVAEIEPRPGSAGVLASAPVQILIIDDQTAVNTGSVQLLLNGTAVPRTVNKVGARTTVSYQPDPARTEVTNRWRLIYSDNSVPARSYTNDWSFTIQVTTGGNDNVAGQWDFDSGDLSATVGQPLEYLDGPSGQTASQTQFGTTASFGIPDIGGVPANVMFVPGGSSTLLGYIMRHGIGANGGGSRVNQYTLVYDIYFEAGPGFASFVNFDLSNNSDGDFFFRSGDGGFGQGGGGYEGNTAIQLQRWHRVAFAVDMAANPPVVVKYLDGVKHTNQLAPNNVLDGERRTMPVGGAVLFGDDDGERHPLYVNSIQVREGRLSDAELAALGGPSASGIATTIPPTKVKGQWDFDFAADKNRLGPTVGESLEFLDGAAGQTASQTQFGTTTSFGIPDIGGVPAGVMFVPGGSSTALGYVMRHGIGANGGGSRVNQYTLVYDIYFEAGPGFASFVNFDLSNNSDGDFFFRSADGGFGQGGGGYEGNMAIQLQRWHRVAFAVDMAANPPVVVKYLDGVKHTNQLAPNNVLDGERRTMPVGGAVLFGDDDGERHPLYVSSIQVREGKLSDAELAALGGPSASGIPVAIPPTKVKGQWDFDFAANKNRLGPTVGESLEYLDGAAGQTASQTQFGTTTSFGIPDIGGVPAGVMFVPGGSSTALGYVMRHGIGANGGGSRVNQYTLVYDIYFEAGPGFASFVNFDLSNTSDGDFFFRSADGGFGQGGGGYEGATRIQLQTWHRVAFAVDMAANPPVVVKYLDGVKHTNQLAPNNVLDGDRRTMPVNGAVLFGDDDGERHPLYVNSIQVREGRLSDAELAALGPPTASGIPVAIAVAPEAVVLIQVQRVGDSVRLSWPASASGYILQWTENLGGSWDAVPNVTGNSADVPITGLRSFFRLIKP